MPRALKRRRRRQQQAAHAGLEAIWGIQAEALHNLIAAGQASGGPLPNFTIEAARDAAPGYSVDRGLAILGINGVLTKAPTLWSALLGSRTYLELADDVDAAAADTAVNAILLIVDSPGGTISGVSDLADAIRAARQVKPVWAYVSDMAASAAYWVASQASRVLADRDAIVGNIGTLLVLADTSAMAKDAGVKVIPIASTPRKADGTPGAPITDAAVSEFQRVVDRLAAEMVADIAAGRGRPASVVGEWADARVHIGADAVGLGLIDAVDSLANVIDQLVSQTSQTNKPPTTGARNMNPKLRAYLESLGLKAEANDTDAIAYWHALPEAERAEADKLANPAALPAAANPPAPPANVPPPAPAAPTAPAPAAADPALAERNRIQAINTIARLHNLGEAWADEMIRGGFAIEQANAAALERLAAVHRPIRPQAPATVGEDRNAASLAAAVTDAIALRAGATLAATDDRDNVVAEGEPTAPRIRTRDPHPRARAFAGRPMVEVIRAYFAALGVPGTGEMSRDTLVRLATNREAFRSAYPSLVQAALAIGDFPSILGTAARRSLRTAYASAPITWPLWCRRGVLPDYRQMTRAALSEAAALTLRRNGMPTKFSTLKDAGQTITLAEYTQGLAITRQAMINDDLGAFSRIPQMQGAAARRLEDELAFYPLTSNQNMTEDSKALFHVDHKNLAGTPAAMAIATIGAGMAAIATQTGPNAQRLGLEAAFLIIPKALELLARQWCTSANDPTTSKNAANPLQNRLTPIASSVLDLSSTTAWYLGGNPAQCDTVEVSFLDDEPNPVLEEITDVETGTVKLHIRHSVAAAAIDFRSLYKNAGA